MWFWVSCAVAFLAFWEDESLFAGHSPEGTGEQATGRPRRGAHRCGGIGSCSSSKHTANLRSPNGRTVALQVPSLVFL